MKRIMCIAALSVAGAAMAHEGVQNPVVAQRMNTMTEIGAASKVLGDMAKGAVAFDAVAARLAAQSISAKAATIAEQFEAQESDPKTEALPAIWENFPDFAEKAAALEQAAFAADGISSLAEVRGALAEIGATCSACHKLYRE
ncbi:cytochrome c [Rhodobacteraceae bacterium]|nr:cytochrome c [Paracoccaceae bacterium]